jgi:FKBP-type peptidyl-prolyl cis-trans isomerase FkpA
MKKYFFLFALLGTVVLSACLKNDDSQLDDDKKIREQFTKDSILMSNFIVAEGIDTSGVRGGLLYEIITPGTGNHVYNANSQVTVKYEGRLLNGTVFDKTTNDAVTFRLGQLVSGWQIGIPLIQKGGKIRLIVPSYYGYGTATQAKIPANSVLDFDIELIDVK